MMTTSLYHLTFPGALLARGFWLYAWKITTAEGKIVVYVGRTGDSSSLNAQSPFTRLGQHLGSNKNANALRRHLEAAEIPPETCREFDLACYGPIFPEASTEREHRVFRDIAAGLEKALRESLFQVGYQVLNEVHCRKTVDEAQLPLILEAFSVPFPKLAFVQHRACRGKR